jgi:hypothetical protein
MFRNDFLTISSVFFGRVSLSQRKKTNPKHHQKHFQKCLIVVILSQIFVQIGWETRAKITVIGDHLETSIPLISINYRQQNLHLNTTQKLGIKQIRRFSSLHSRWKNTKIIWNKKSRNQILKKICYLLWTPYIQSPIP